MSEALPWLGPRVIASRYPYEGASGSDVSAFDRVSAAGSRGGAMALLGDGQFRDLGHRGREDDAAERWLPPRGRAEDVGRQPTPPPEAQRHARGANQVAYLRSILDHDLAFGIGPAGTGKTYLAVAAAASMLDAMRLSAVLALPEPSPS